MKQVQQLILKTLTADRFIPIQAANYIKPYVGLGIYREAYFARLTKALQKIYRQCEALLGSELFLKIAAHYIFLHPSHFFNIQDYGKYLPDYILAHGYDKYYPFLFDLARFEWHKYWVFNGPEDIKPDPEYVIQTWAKLDEHSVLTLPLNTQLIRLQYSPESLDKKQTYLAIFKIEDRLIIENLTPDEFIFLKLLQMWHPLYLIFEGYKYFSTTTGAEEILLKIYHKGLISA